MGTSLGSPRLERRGQCFRSGVHPSSHILFNHCCTMPVRASTASCPISKIHTDNALLTQCSGRRDAFRPCCRETPLCPYWLMPPCLIPQLIQRWARLETEHFAPPVSTWDPSKEAQQGDKHPKHSPSEPCCFPGPFHCILLTSLFGWNSLVLTNEH